MKGRSHERKTLFSNPSTLFSIRDYAKHMRYHPLQIRADETDAAVEDATDAVNNAESQTKTEQTDVDVESADIISEAEPETETDTDTSPQKKQSRQRQNRP